MISAEAQRKLVKSPPELWAELSDPAALGRHLGELGEIQITNAEPERSVEWEAEAARGKVELKPSGWGTQVTLTIARELPSCATAQESEPAQAEPEPTEPEQAEPQPAEPEPVQELKPDPEPQPPPRRFFARIFKRKSKPDLEPPAPPGPSPEEIAAEQAAAAEAMAAKQAAAEAMAAKQAAAEAMAAQRAAAEEEIAAQTAELLNGVLDRLGAAHHRPFSRA